MPYDICITLFFNNKVHDPVVKFLFILFSSVLLSSTGLLIWLVLLRTSLYFSCVLGFEEPIRCEMCLPTFLVICFTCGMYMHLVFTTRFEMLSVFIIAGAWWHFWTSNLPILSMNKFVTMLLSLNAKYSTQWRAT